MSAGQLGGAPSVKGQQLNATVSSQSLLQTQDDFRNIVLKSDSTGAKVLLSDVARVEKGAESYMVNGYYNGKAASGLAIQLAPGANALETKEAVLDRMAELEAFFRMAWKWSCRLIPRRLSAARLKGL